MTRHVSISFLAPLMLLLPVLVVSSVILIISSFAARQAAERQANTEMARIQSAVIQRVDGLLTTPMRVTQLNHDLLNQSKLDASDTASWKQTLLAQAKAFPSLSAITWGGENRTATWIARYGRAETKLYYAVLTTADAGQMKEFPVDQAGVVAGEPESTFTYDPTGRPWYMAAANAGQPVWSEPYAWAGDTSTGTVTMGLSYSRPYTAGNGERLGVLSADLNLDDVSAFLAGLKIGETGQCYIVDEQGQLVATSVDVPLVDEDKRLVQASGVGEPLIKVAATYWASTSTGNKDQSRLQSGDVDAFTMRSPIGRETGLTWTIVTAIPASDFMADAQRAMRNTLLICVGVIVLTLAAGLMIARGLSRPIVALESHAQRVGEGDFDSQIDLNQSTEFARLSEALNKMSVELKDRIQLRRSLAMAMEVQQSLLPGELPKVQGLQVAGNSNYCEQTGGDYYDFLELSGLSNQSVAVVVGDVMGHGIAAAMLMATARGILRSRSSEPGGTGELIQHLNEQLVQVTQGSRFMTMIMASVDSESRLLRWASAGHDPPFIFDPTNDQFLELEGGGLPLGVMAEETYEEMEVGPLPVGTVVAFMTDGIFEARNKDEQHYGKQRIMEIIREHHQSPANEIARALEEDLEQFQVGTPQEDDITYVIVKVSGV